MALIGVQTSLFTAEAAELLGKTGPEVMSMLKGAVQIIVGGGTAPACSAEESSAVCAWIVGQLRIAT
ncbi:MAG: hypothetical protein VKI83_01320 [Synechococcaceae cyanobacterium]|nr:hypothetical protein [Synechococcaceae cyanobacterium]